MNEALRAIKDIRLRSRWDGRVKYFTGDCLECQHYELLSDGEVCFTSNSWKVLTREKVLKSCPVKKRVDKETIVKQRLLEEFLSYNQQ